MYCFTLTYLFSTQSIVNKNIIYKQKSHPKSCGNAGLHQPFVHRAAVWTVAQILQNLTQRGQHAPAVRRPSVLHTHCHYECVSLCPLELQPLKPETGAPQPLIFCLLSCVIERGREAGYYKVLAAGKANRVTGIDQQPYQSQIC